MAAAQNPIKALFPCNLCQGTKVLPRFAATDLDNTPLPAVFACTSEGHGVHGPIVECVQCGLVFADPLPSDALLAEAYSKTQDTLYLEEERYRVENFKPLLASLETLSQSSSMVDRSLVDVGCHVGTFLDLARTAGWKVSGTEPSKWAASIAQERGLDVICGGIDHFAEVRKQASFDVVTLWDVLEHLADPMADLQKMRRLLRPGGRLVLTTIDIGSLFAKAMGSRWPWLMHMHLYYFTHSTLQKYLTAAGFENIEIRSCSRTVSLGYATYKAGLTFGIGISAAATLLKKTRMANLAVPIKLGDIVMATGTVPRSSS